MSLRSVLLAMLSKQPNTGYGLGRALRESLGHIWSARLQQIYSELAKLEHDGLVDVARYELPNRPAKKVYSLTAVGEGALDGWLVAQPGPQPQKDDLLVRVYCLERMAPAAAKRMLETRREACERSAKELLGQLAQAQRTSPDAFGLLLTLEAAIARAEGHATWCSRALDLLGDREAGRGPPEARAAGA